MDWSSIPFYVHKEIVVVYMHIVFDVLIDHSHVHQNKTPNTNTVWAVQTIRLESDFAWKNYAEVFNRDRFIPVWHKT